MFTLELGDYKYIFEYDTKEELEEYLKITMATHEQAEAIRNRHVMAHKAIAKEEASPRTSDVTWADLEVKFIASKKKLKKVSVRSYRAYETTFNKLKEYFQKRKIADLTIEDYEEFREHMVNVDELKSKTINNHLAYINKFLNFAVTYKLLPENNIKGIETLKEDDSIPKENFTDEDIKAIFSYDDYPTDIRDIFILAAYTGMRVGEILRIEREHIIYDEKADFHYIDVHEAKTKAGIRKVPIHKDILDRVLNHMEFPFMSDKTEDAAQKVILRQLYKVIPKTGIKTFHTFRGTFMEKCLEKNPRDLLMIQEIVGHRKSEGVLTIDDYAKGFKLHKLKKEIVDSVVYSFE